MDVNSSRPCSIGNGTRPFPCTAAGKKSEAFTLIELMITLSVAAALVSLAAPSLRDFLLSTRMTARVNQLLGDFHLARSAAIKTRKDVVICVSRNGARCSQEGWEVGWLIFVDDNRNRTPDPGEKLLRIQQALEGGTITYRAFGSNFYIAYRQTGDTRTNGTFTFCDERGAEKAKALILYKTGRVRSSSQASGGSALDCPNE